MNTCGLTTGSLAERWSVLHRFAPLLPLTCYASALPLRARPRGFKLDHANTVFSRIPPTDGGETAISHKIHGNRIILMYNIAKEAQITLQLQTNTHSHWGTTIHCNKFPYYNRKIKQFVFEVCWLHPFRDAFWSLALVVIEAWSRLQAIHQIVQREN